MSEDYGRSGSASTFFITNKLLLEIQRLLHHYKHKLDDFDFPSINIEFLDDFPLPRITEDELSIQIPDEDLISIKLLNTQQRMAFDTIVESIIFNQPNLFFIDGPGGTGKTFLYRAILARLRKEGKIIIVVATSGIAATQILPVVKRGTMRDQIAASILRSTFWNRVKILHLQQNMRSVGDNELLQFMLRIGDGMQHSTNGDFIKLPDSMIISWKDDDSINQLIDYVFPDMIHHVNYANYMVGRAIITPKNRDVDKINEMLISKFLGEERVYTS
ncbi:uncharacterized protein [Henckelia pumila]|uniref:uncharacterized protein n=1 Tax=Henckelia pumila TaxID=405737 RepID=UPI003C6E3D5E